MAHGTRFVLVEDGDRHFVHMGSISTGVLRGGYIQMGVIWRLAFAMHQLLLQKNHPARLEDVMGME